MSNDTAPLDNNQLAMQRTWLAHERTLMAWVRTATSMISFGFTIYKFFQFEAEGAVKITRGLITPRDFALVIVSIGVLSLLMATIQHRSELRELRGQLKHPRRSMAEVVAGLVSLFGVLVLLSAVFHR